MKNMSSCFGVALALLASPCLVNSTYASVEGPLSVTTTHSASAFSAKSLKAYEDGKVVEGVKHGVWEGYFAHGAYHFTEIYENGLLIKGTTQDAQGQTYNYEQLHETDGREAFVNSVRNHVYQHFVMPHQASKAGIAGTVLVSFDLNTDGKIDNIAILDHPGFGTEKETLRILSTLKNKSWNPVKWRGVPQQENFTFPIALKVVD